MSDFPYQGDEPYVYASYARADGSQCKPEIEHLHALGYRVHYSDAEPDELMVHDAAFVVFFVSEGASDSEELKEELQAASQAGKDGLAIYLGEVSTGGTVGLLLGGFDDVKKYRMKEAFYRRRLETAIDASMRRPGVTPPPIKEEPAAPVAMNIHRSRKSGGGGGGGGSFMDKWNDMEPGDQLTYGVGAFLALLILVGFLYIATGDGSETTTGSADGAAPAPAATGDNGEGEGDDGSVDGSDDEPTREELERRREEREAEEAALSEEEKKERAEWAAREKANAQFMAGMAKFNEGDYAAAVAAYEGAVSERPDYLPYRLRRAEAYYRNRQDEKALADYAKCLELDPKHIPAYLGRAEMHKYKHPDKAIEDFTKVIEISDKVYEAWLGRADAKKKKGDLEGAIADYTKAIEIDPAYAPYYGRSVCKKKLGDSEGAFEDMKLAKEAGIR